MYVTKGCLSIEKKNKIIKMSERWSYDKSFQVFNFVMVGLLEDNVNTNRKKEM